MKRRTFVGAIRDAGILAGGGWLLGPAKVAASAAGPASQADYDLVAVKNAEPDALFDAGIEALGGMRRRNSGDSLLNCTQHPLKLSKLSPELVRPRNWSPELRWRERSDR